MEGSAPVAPQLVQARPKPGTPSLLRELNDRAALELLLAEGPLTRAQLSERTGVSKVTGSQVLARLEERGLVMIAGQQAGGRGPNAALYAVVPTSAYVAGLYVELDQVSTAVADVTGRRVAEVTVDPNGADDPVGMVVGAISQACASAGIGLSRLSAVVIGSPGVLDPNTGAPRLAVNLPTWHEGVLDGLRDVLHTPVVIENDVNLAAMAERADGAAAGQDDFAFVWLGGGLGFAVDLGGRILDGARGAAGEIGQLRVPGDSIGLTGSVVLDDALDRSVLVAMAERHGIQAAPAELADVLRHHPARAQVFAELAPRVALAIPPALAVLDPELVVLGGPVGAAGGALLATLVQECVARELDSAPTIVCAAATDDPVLAGARHLLTGTNRTRLLDAAASYVPG